MTFYRLTGGGVFEIKYPITDNTNKVCAIFDNNFHYHKILLIEKNELFILGSLIKNIFENGTFKFHVLEATDILFVA